MQQRGRMRLRVRRCVAPDDACGARREAEQLDERCREPHRLVRDDAPAHAARIEFVEHVADTREQRGMHAQIGRVVGEELVAHRVVARRVRVDTERAAEQPARAGRGQRPQHVERRFGQAAFALHLVDGCREIGRRVGERAVQVEQDRIAVQQARFVGDPRGRKGSRHAGRGVTRRGGTRRGS